LKPTKSSNCPSLHLANQQESRGIITCPFLYVFRTNHKWVQTYSRHPVTYFRKAGLLGWDLPTSNYFVNPKNQEGYEHAIPLVALSNMMSGLFLQ
jgi:hypothetical protein